MSEKGLVGFCGREEERERRRREEEIVSSSSTLRSRNRSRGKENRRPTYQLWRQL